MGFRWIGKSEDNQTVTLNRLDEIRIPSGYATQEWMDANPDAIRTGVVIDVETTGLNKNEDKIIEIGLRQFKFNRLNGDVLAAGEAYSGLEDPGMPLSVKIMALTGLTDADLSGQLIDWKTVGRLISEAQVVIAHNASFDRPFLERYLSESSQKIWGCSLSQIDWNSKGFPTRKLEFLSIYHGFFTDAHRALNDSDALLYLLSFRDENTGNSYLNELLMNARRPLVRVIARNSPFDSKDFLKARGYSWDGKNKWWHTTIYKDQLEFEIPWLESDVYHGPFSGLAYEISAVDNFKTTSLS